MWRNLPSERIERIFGEGVTRQNITEMDATERSKRIRQYSYKVTNIANKRIGRLEEKELSSPAYRFYQEELGGERLGIRGKDDDGVIQTIQQAERFNFMQTSTLGGTNTYLRNIGERLGLDVSNTLQIQAQSSKIFAVTHKIDEYLRSGGGGTAIGSDELQRYVSSFIRTNNLADMDVDSIVDMLSEVDIYSDVQRGITSSIRAEIEEIDGLGGFGDFLV